MGTVRRKEQGGRALKRWDLQKCTNGDIDTKKGSSAIFKFPK